MSDFFAELRRRHIFRIGAVYVVVAWGIIQVLDVLSQLFALPDWIAQPAVVVLAIGFPVTLIAAWMIVGAVKSADTPAGRFKATATDWVLASVLVAVIGVIGFQQMGSRDGTSVSPDTLTSAPSDGFNSSVAVLPLVNLSPDPENAFFADGIHSELLTQLHKIASLKVISRTSVMEYRDTPKNMREIGEELGVTNILEGDVRRAGDTIRINVQLIDAESDGLLWSQPYQRELSTENLIAIQTEIATAIASALQTTLSPQEVARLNEIPTRSTEAYDFYLRGIEIIDAGAEQPPLRVEMFERAVIEDPSFSLAWAKLSEAHSAMYWWGVDRSPARLDLALEAVEKAFEISPGLPEAHMAMGFYYADGLRDWARALTEYETAEMSMPSDPSVLFAKFRVQRRLGQWDQSLLTLERALQLDPRNSRYVGEIGFTLLNLRDYSRAEEYFNNEFEISRSAIAFNSVVALPMYREGDVSEMQEAFENPPIDLLNRRDEIGVEASIYERDYQKAIEIIETMEQEALTGQNDYSPKALLIGELYSLAGESDAAEDYFQQAKLELEGLLQQNENDPRLVMALARALVGLGEIDVASEHARDAMEAVSPTLDAISGPAYQLQAALGVFAPADDNTTAIELLDSYLGSPGVWSIEGLLPDPRLDPIRDDPRFVALVEKYRRQ